MTGYVYLLVATVSLGLLGIFHKVADHRGCRPEAINLFLFAFASTFAVSLTLVRLGPAASVDIPAIAVLTATVCGTLTSVAILNFQRGVRFGRISTSWLIMNLSTSVPTVLSILLYREAVSGRRLAGLLLSVAALLMLWVDTRRKEASG